MSGSMATEIWYRRWEIFFVTPAFAGREFLQKSVAF
jgi:hypothetical protein